MNSFVREVILPPVPPRRPRHGHTGKSTFSDLEDRIDDLHRWAGDLIVAQRRYLQQLADQINSQVQGYGPPIASAATIVVSNPNHHITGTAAISRITPPPGFSGPIVLIADGAFSLVTGGNIAQAAGPFLIGQHVILNYDPHNQLWYIAFPISLDTQVVDGATFGRVLGAALTAGQVDLSRPGVINKALGNLSGNLDNISDGVTFVKVLGAALTANQVDLAKSGVVNRVLANIGDDTTGNTPRKATVVGLLANRPAAGTNGRMYLAADQGTNGTLYRDTGSAWVKAGIGHFADADGNLDNIGDGATFAKVRGSDQTGNRIDFSKSLLNKQLDNIPDGATFARPLGAALTAGRVDLSLSGVISKTLQNISDQTSGTVRYAMSSSTTKTFTAAGATTFTTPAGATALLCFVWGAGGGGGGGGGAGTFSGGGAGAGALFVKIILSPAASYTVTVGAKGAGGAVNNDGTDGGDSSVGTAAVAKGGQRGFQGNVLADGSGGLGGATQAANEYNVLNTAGAPGGSGGGGSGGSAGVGPGGNGGGGGSPPSAGVNGDDGKVIIVTLF